jgi:hypothetical protein
VHIPLKVIYQLAIVRDREREKAQMTMLSHLGGRKFKNKFLPKIKGFQQLTDTGVRLADINEQLVEESRRFNKIKEDGDLKIDKVLEKLAELCYA